MGKNKLARFAENATFPNFFQPELEEVKAGYFMKGKWRENYFKNENSLILELGCGKGEYSLGLAERYPEKNFIAVDIKGARMWRGCKTSNENGMKNIAFLRTRIELISCFFEEKEVDEIWVTFPDPHPKRIRENKRLTSPPFLSVYKKMLKDEGIVHLKTDAVSLYEYTLEVINEHKHHIILNTDDLYNSGIEEDVMGIQTFYEKMFLAEGKKITYTKFKLK